ncbi:pyrimidine 5'-nucleotidase [Tubulinosema ratisbonensis]|uniref:Pyrimidine 5'-nucleotidase n=1 Tax=Tubulinosema ratisbonensis TaxID=291195 RepID=A0A437AIG2_9MICR|nr:pyrimidine 5'-nucleotidase [Tubulinosema ratisbonensis]
MTIASWEQRFFYIEDLSNYTFPNTIDNLYVFDIDETLYPSDDKIKLMRLEELNIFSDALKIPKEGRREIFKGYDKKYGSVIGGLVNENDLSPENYEYLKEKTASIKMNLSEDEELKNLITQLKGTKICLTNAEKIYAHNVLLKLGLLSSFDLVICSNYYRKNTLCKPFKEVYTLVEQSFKAKNIHFFDDKKCNLKIPRKLGWNVYYVTPKRHIKYHLKNINKIQ